MRALQLTIAAAAALTIVSSAHAQTKQVEIKLEQNFGILAPAPGKIVEINGMKCIQANVFDRSVWCAGYGKLVLTHEPRTADKQ